MARKSSGSSRRGKRITVSAESIFSKPLNKRQKAVLARIAARQAAGDDSGIDYSDIPALTDEQLSRFRRGSKVLVAARLDRDVYDIRTGLFDPHQQHPTSGDEQGTIVPTGVVGPRELESLTSTVSR